VAVKIRLKRLGKIRAPYYRVVVVDSRAKRDGRVIEEIGKYHPTEDPSLIEINSERAQYWLSVGAQPTEPVLAQLKLTGDWQKFKGLPYEEGSLKVPARRAKEIAAAELAKAEEQALKNVSQQAEQEAKAKAKAAEETKAAQAEAVTDPQQADAAVVDAPDKVPAAQETAESQPDKTPAEG
jgi:small subunit ribosomal protein S16